MRKSMIHRMREPFTMRPRFGYTATSNWSCALEGLDRRQHRSPHVRHACWIRWPADVPPRLALVRCYVLRVSRCLLLSMLPRATDIDSRSEQTFTVPAYSTGCHYRCAEASPGRKHPVPPPFVYSLWLSLILSSSPRRYK